MARLLLACSVAAVPFALSAGVCDELAFAQVGVSSHREVPPLETPRRDFDSKAIAARIRAQLEQVVGNVDKSKMDASLTGQRASSLNELGSGSDDRRETSLGLASAGESLQVDRTYGMTIQRESSFVEQGSKVSIELARGCNDTDTWGSNNCLIPANDKVHLKISYTLREPVTQGATMQTNFTTRLYGLAAIIGQQLRGWKNDRFVQDLEPVNNTCPLCGGHCKLQFMGKELVSEMPPCPMPANVENVLIDQEFHVPPTNGLKLLRSKYVGSVVLRRADGSMLANTTGLVRFGEAYVPPCPLIMSYLNKCKN